MTVIEFAGYHINRTQSMEYHDEDQRPPPPPRLKLFCAIVVLACAIGSIALAVPTSAQSPESPAAAPTIKLRAGGWIGINWNEITGAEYYKVQLQGTRTDGRAWQKTKRTSNNHSYGFITRHYVPANVLEVTARVAAIRSDGSTGVWSATSTPFTLQPISTRPTVSFTNNGRIDVRWTAESGADRYEVWFRGTYTDGSTADWKQSVGTTNAPATSQTFNIGTGCQVPPVDKIRARVRAIRDSGTNSHWSHGSAWLAIPDPVSHSSGMTLGHEGSHFVVRWPAVAGAENYSISVQQATCSNASAGSPFIASVPKTAGRQASFAISWAQGVKVRAYVTAYRNANGTGLISPPFGWSPYLIVKK